MAEAGYTTQTTVTQTSTTVQTNLRYDPTYVRTVPGALKCAQLILDILIFITISVGHVAFSSLSFLSFLGGFGFWITGALLLFYLFHIVEKFYKIPWIKIEMVFCALWAFFFLIGSSVCVSHLSYDVIFGVAGFFGYLAMIAYGYDAFLKFRAFQNGEIAQGEREVQKTTTTAAASPAY